MSDEQDRARVTYGADIPYPMTEARARELIRESSAFRDWCPAEFDDEKPEPPTINIDGHLTADELEAFAWWLRNKPNEEP